MKGDRAALATWRPEQTGHREADVPAEKLRRRCHHLALRPIPLNGNNLAATQRVQKIERQERSRRVVINLDCSFAAFFERSAQMFRSLPVRFGARTTRMARLNFSAKSAAPKS